MIINVRRQVVMSEPRLASDLDKMVEQLGPEMSTLSLQLLLRSVAERERINEQLFTHWKNRAQKAEAEVELIRDNIDTLLREPYHPSAVALQRALYPSDAAVCNLVEELHADQQ